MSYYDLVVSDEVQRGCGLDLPGSEAKSARDQGPRCLLEGCGGYGLKQKLLVFVVSILYYIVVRDRLTILRDTKLTPPPVGGFRCRFESLMLI